MTNDVPQPAASSLDSPLWVIVPAAGSGQRLGGGTLAKQYRLLDGVAMLQRTIERMLQVPGVEGVVIVVAPDDEHWQLLCDDLPKNVHSTIGGTTRAESVLAGIQYVLSKAPENAWLLVHDAARPLVAVSDVQRLTNAVYNSGATGGLLATRVQDTLKRCHEYYTVGQTVERVDLWQAQTPQLFRAGELNEALQVAITTHADSVTDESSAMELAGHTPLLVEALKANFKITRPVDWDMASALIQAERLNKGINQGQQSS